MKIILTDELTGKRMELSGTNTERVLKANIKVIAKFLSGFGRASIVVMNEQTGEVVQEGWYECNVFSGKGGYELRRAI